MPIIVIAEEICQGWLAAAKIKAPPPAPSASSAALVRLGPKVSKAQPTGICIKAKVKNQ